MENRLEDLHLRFQKKGFMPIEIQSLMEDVFKILSNGRHRTRNAVNREMESLGWGIEIIDSVTYKLAISLK